MDHHEVGYKISDDDERCPVCRQRDAKEYELDRERKEFARELITILRETKNPFLDPKVHPSFADRHHGAGWEYGKKDALSLIAEVSGIDQSDSTKEK